MTRPTRAVVAHTKAAIALMVTTLRKGYKDEEKLPKWQTRISR